ncbi:MAG: pilus assembly protein TadG-related protein [Hyphomicrobiales bacterium]
MPPKSLNLISRFIKNERGQIAILMAVLFVPLAVLFGGAVDWAIKVNHSSKQQHALDAAILAAVVAIPDPIKHNSERKKRRFRKAIFRKIYKINYDKKLPTFKFKFTKSGMSVTSLDEVKTTILALANINSFKITSAATALYKKDTTFEIVLIFDATGSMGGIIAKVKSNATNFTDDILTQLQTKGIQLDNIDTKVISYKDYWVDSDAMFESRFYHLPAEKQQFSAIISPIRASGGGDLPESGLEAIKLAIDAEAPSRIEGAIANKIIVLWTDAEAIPLKNQRKSAVDNGLITTSSSWAPWYKRSDSRYPSGMPNNLNKFKRLWNQDKNAKMLLFYGKHGSGTNFYPWKQMKEWDRMKHIIGNPNNIDYSDLIEEIAVTISQMSKTRLSE